MASSRRKSPTASRAPPDGHARPRVLVIGGLDPSGRAGVAADLWALGRSRADAAVVVSALTAQGQLFSSEPVRPRMFQAQLEAVLDSGPVHAVKLGMIPGRRWLTLIQERLPEDVPWVVDPVVQTSRGQRLSTLRAEDYRGLGGKGRVFLTPNTVEAGWLLGESKTHGSLEESECRARALVEQGFEGVVVKGGHLASGPSIDVLCEVGRRRLTRLRSERLVRDGARHRGTGCRHASALASGLARGQGLTAAARSAHALVRGYLLGSG